MVQVLSVCGRLQRPTDPWSSIIIAAQAHRILITLAHDSSSIQSFVDPYIHQIIAQSLRPAFLHTMHPSIHPLTGRRVPWPKEKPSTFSMDQAWKDQYPGTTTLLEWVIDHLTVRPYPDPSFHHLTLINHPSTARNTTE